MTPEQRRSRLIKLLAKAALRAASVSDNDGHEPDAGGAVQSVDTPNEEVELLNHKTPAAGHRERTMT